MIQVGNHGNTVISPRLAHEIDRSFEFLETEWRDVPGRHRSIRAVFDASWQRLSPIEKDVFAQLSVFRGGFTRMAAKEVTRTTLRALAPLFVPARQFAHLRLDYKIGTDVLGFVPFVNRLGLQLAPFVDGAAIFERQAEDGTVIDLSAAMPGATASSSPSPGRSVRLATSPVNEFEAMPGDSKGSEA